MLLSFKSLHLVLSPRIFLGSPGVTGYVWRVSHGRDIRSFRLPTRTPPLSRYTDSSYGDQTFRSVLHEVREGQIDPLATFKDVERDVPMAVRTLAVQCLGTDPTCRPSAEQIAEKMRILVD